MKQQAVGEGFVDGVLSIVLDAMREVASPEFFVAFAVAVALGFVVKFQVAAWAPVCGETRRRWAGVVSAVFAGAGAVSGIGLGVLSDHGFIAWFVLVVCTPTGYLLFIAASPHRFKYFLLTDIGWRWYIVRRREYSK